MTPEGKVKAFIDKKMKAWFPDALKYSPPGGRFGRAGMPDRLWFVRGGDTTCIVVAIEAKAEGGRLTQLQTLTLAQFANRGAVSVVVTGQDEERMEMVRNEILRRICLAHAQPGASTV